jgi:hypothetical protein
MKKRDEWEPYYTMAIARQWPVNSNRGTVFSVEPLPKCYKQDKLEESVS